MERSRVINKKLTYGDKSGSNWIEFDGVTTKDKVILRLHYVFDRTNHEFEDYSFVLSEEEFNALLSGLNSNGSSQINKEDLTFEWRWQDGQLEFKLNGRRNTSPFSGPSWYSQSDFFVINNITNKV